jgi:hypothetical protein
VYKICLTLFFLVICAMIQYLQYLIINCGDTSAFYIYEIHNTSYDTAIVSSLSIHRRRCRVRKGWCIIYFVNHVVVLRVVFILHI